MKPDRPGAIEELEKAAKHVYWGSPIKRILILSNIPSGEYDGGMWHFPCIYWWDRRAVVGWWFFQNIGEDEVNGHVSAANYKAPWIIDNETGEFHIWVKGKGMVRGANISTVSDMILNPQKDINKQIREEQMIYNDYSKEFKDQLYDFLFNGNREINHTVFEAFDAARKARFEHGETPTIKSAKFN